MPIITKEVAGIYDPITSSRKLEERPVTEALLALVNKMTLTHESSVSPDLFKAIFNSLKTEFDNVDQHDAEEFHNELLDLIHTETRNTEKKVCCYKNLIFV